MSRSSSTVATPLFLKVFFISEVATVSKPGTFPLTMLGIGQLRFWNPSGPKGIFIGIAGLPAGETLALIFFFSNVSP